MANNEVFISYKADEIAEALWVKENIESNGISCWMAPMSIPGGSSYASEIENAIRNCKIFVLILSDKSQNSKWVTKELDRAINAEKVIMPFDIDNCVLNDAYNFYLTDVQRYEAYADKSNAMQRMLADIRNELNGVPKSEPKTEPQPEPQPEPKLQPKPQFKVYAKPRAKSNSEPAVKSTPSYNRKSKSKIILIIASIIIALVVFLAVFLDTTKTETTPAEKGNSYEQLLNFTFELDGIEYQLPCDYTEFTDNGWVLVASYTEAEKKLAGKGTDSFSLKKNGHTVQVGVYNPSGNSKPITESVVGSISSLSDSNNRFEFSNGISAKSSGTEIVAHFGKNYEHYKDKTSEKFKYYISTEDKFNQYIEFTCYSDGKDNSINIKNFGDYKKVNPAETNNNYPEYLNSYLAPVNLYESKSYAVKIDNKIYGLPAPVEEFTDDGWVIENPPVAIPAQSVTFLTLVKGDKEIEVTVKNFADYQTVAENCAVSKVTVNAPMNASFSDAPYIGTPKSSIDGSYSNFTKNNFSDYTRYRLWDIENGVDISFKVDKSEKKVTCVEYEHSEWTYG